MKNTQSKKMGHREEPGYQMLYHQTDNNNRSQSRSRAHPNGQHIPIIETGIDFKKFDNFKESSI
jgi:hypothetical protein